MKSSFPLVRRAQFAQVLDGQREKTSHPFFFEKLLGRFWGRNQSGVHYGRAELDRKSTRLNSSHLVISYAVFCLKKKKDRLLPDQHRQVRLFQSTAVRQLVPNRASSRPDF